LTLPAEGGSWVLQRYIDDPFLVLGHKFDIRLYVVVHTVTPLELYIHKDGLVRYATEKYITGCSEKGSAGWSRSTHLTALYPQPKEC